MATEYEIKKQICEIGKRIYNRGMVASNDGNISVKLNDNEFLCTPTGVSKGFMTPEYICKVDAKGNVLQAYEGFKPSSEIKMHMRVYKERPDVNSVVHAHPVYATSFAMLEFRLSEPIMPEAVIALGLCADCRIRARRPPKKFRTPFPSIFRIMMPFFLKITAHLLSRIRFSMLITRWNPLNSMHSCCIRQRCSAARSLSPKNRFRDFMRFAVSSA